MSRSDKNAQPASCGEHGVQGCAGSSKPSITCTITPSSLGSQPPRTKRSYRWLIRALGEGGEGGQSGTGGGLTGGAGRAGGGGADGVGDAG